MKNNPLFWILSISGLFFVAFVSISIGLLFSMGSGGRSSERKLFSGSGDEIGVLEISGVIMDSKKTIENIRKFSEESSIKGVIVRINSPGGAVAPSQEIYQAIKRLSAKKPVFASMSSLAASGGYYVAVGTSKIFANPGTITGSIGVIMQFADLSRLYEWAKVNPYVIKTGKYKDIGSPTREMSDEEKALLKGMADNVLSQFRKAVAEGRKLPYEKVVEVSDGRIFSGEQARDLKLVDELGGLQEAAEAIAKAAGITGKPRLVYPPKKKKFMEYLMSDDEDDADSESRSFVGKLSMILDFAAEFMGAGSSFQQTSTSTRVPLVGPLVLMPHVVR